MARKSQPLVWRKRHGRRSLKLPTPKPLFTRLGFEPLEHRWLLSVTPLGSEFQVNTTTAGPQEGPAVAADAAGNYVAVWQGNGTGDADGIFAQRFDSAGVAQGGEILVNTFTSTLQRNAAVAMDADGDFVVSWESYGQGVNAWSVYAQRFNAAGTAEGSEFLVAQFDKHRPAVAMDADGDFVIAWESWFQDGHFYGVYAQRYGAAGNPQGTEFQVNTYTTGNQGLPTVAMDADGDFVVAWQSGGQDGSGYGVYAQRFDAAGVPQGTEFQVSTVTTGEQAEPAVAMDADGNFVIVWLQDDSSLFGSYVRRYDSAGVAQGDEFLVNTYIDNQQIEAAVAMDLDGDFVVSWTSFNQDTWGYGVYAQAYNSAGVAQGGEFPVNTTTTFDQRRSAVAMDADGDLVIVWQSQSQDGDNWGIYAQQYDFENDEPPAGTNVGIDGSGNLVIDDVLAEGKDDSLVITLSGSNIRVHDPENELTAGDGVNQIDSNTVEVALVSVTGQLLVNTLAGSDALTFDFAGGNPIPLGGVVYDGGVNGSDVLQLTGGSFTTVAYSFTGPNDGSVDLDGRMISYTGLEPITSSVMSDTVELVFTGGSETITLSDAGGGMTTVDSTLGETTTFANPTSQLRVLATNGSDIIDVDSLASGYASLEISGDDVSDVVNFNGPITPAMHMNVGVNDVGTINLPNAASDFAMTGDGGIFFNALRNISLSSGSSLSSELGDIDLLANQQETPACGNFVGIRLDGANVTTSEALITITGRGGDTGSGNHGVELAGGAVVESTFAGEDALPLVIEGTGGASGSEYNSNFGVHLVDAGTAVAAVDGYIEIIGQGGTSSQNNVGVRLFGGAMIASTGLLRELAGITIQGTGGGGSSSSDAGVELHSSSIITSVHGDIDVFGEGGATVGAGSHGIFVGSGSIISSTGIGADAAVVTLGGTAGTSSNSGNSGVRIQNAGTQVTAVDGEILISGHGGAVQGVGVAIFSSAVVSSTGTGTDAATITIDAMGGDNGGSANLGLTMGGGLITSVVGDIQVVGRGGLGTGNLNYGVAMSSGSVISSTGTGPNAATITIEASGGGTGESSNDNLGIQIQSATANIATVDGDIQITATAGVGASTALELIDSDKILLTGTANLSLIADSMNIAATNAIAAGANTVLLQPQTAGGAIDLGGSDAAGVLGLSDDELDRITAGTLILGDASAGPITVSTAITRPSTTNIELHSGGAIVFDPGSVDTGGGDLMLAPGAGSVEPITSGIDAAASTVSFASDLGIVIDGTVVDTDYTQLNVDGTVNLAGVDLVLSGAYVPAPGNSFTIVSADSVTGEFSGLMDGTTLVFNGETLMINYSANAVTLTLESMATAPLGLFAADGYQEVSEAERLVENPAQLIVAFDGELSTAGGANGPTSVTNPANWILTKDTVDISGQITGIKFEFDATFSRWEATVSLSAALTDGEYELALSDSVEDLAGNALDGDGDTNAGGDFLRSFSVRVPTALGSEYWANATTAGPQEQSSVAADAAGNYVVVWSGNGPGDGGGIFGQRYNAAGVAQGSEFLVNTFTTGLHWGPTVAIDDDGDFVVAWVSASQDGSSDGVYAQRFNSSGVAQGSEFRVNTNIAGQQNIPAVAIDADGDFVVAWRSQTGDGSGYGIYAQRYDAAGVAQGSEFLVNTTTASEQREPAVAMDADGNFVVAWHSNQDGSGYGIYAQRYDAAGVAQGGEFLVNTYTTSAQREPTVAMDSEGNFVVAWQSLSQDAGGGYGVYAQRYNAAGVAQGSEFRANTYTSSSQSNPAVAMDADGDFVVTWQSYGQDGSNYGIYAQRYNAAGVAQGSEFRVNTYTSGTQWRTAAAMDADGDFVVVWQSQAQDGDNWGIYAQRYGVDVYSPAPLGLFVADGYQEVSEAERLVETPTELIVAFDEELSTAGGASGPNSVTNPANWQLTEDTVDISGQITGITFEFDATWSRWEATVSLSAALTDGDYELTLQNSVEDLSGNALDGDGDTTAGGDFVRVFSILVPVPVGGEFRVNTTTAGSQQRASVGADAAGNYVVVWNGYGPGTVYGIFAQRYNADGVAQGSEFRVNTTLASTEDPSVAMNADGAFVVTWRGNGTVYVQRYDAAGMAQGSEIPVSGGIIPTVAIDADGDFVVSWYSGDASLNGVYAQRYDADGNPQGSVFQVNAYTLGRQDAEVIAMDAGGNFVIAWHSDGQDGSGFGIYAQRYNASGVAQGGEFRVNMNTAGNQLAPNIGMDVAGNFIIAWHSNGQDGSGYGIYAQRYNAAGVAQGGEIPVNTLTAGNQLEPSISLDADGDFVVTWYSAGQDGSGYGVYAQRYNAAGVAQGGEFRVNNFTAGNQSWSAVAMDTDGDFIITWQSDGQDGDSGGIYAQRYGVITNQPPSADAGGPYTLDLGQDLTLDGSGSTDADAPAGDFLASYAWDLDNDGQFDDATGQQPLIPWATLAGLGLGLGTHTIGLQVTDSFGATDSETTTLSIYDNRPFASFTAMPNPAAPGQVVIFDASASYHGRPDRQIVKYEFVFGDGNTYVETPTSAPDGLFDGKTTHAYSSAAEYEPQLIVTDNNVPARTDSAVALVSLTPVLFGDYNDNGKVDAADYTVWRDTLTAGGTVLLNDPTPGIVDESDFLYWRAHFGEILAMGSGASAASAPAVSQAFVEPVSQDAAAEAPLIPPPLVLFPTVEMPNRIESTSRSGLESRHENTSVPSTELSAPSLTRAGVQSPPSLLSVFSPTKSIHRFRQQPLEFDRVVTTPFTNRALDLLLTLDKSKRKVPAADFSRDIASTEGFRDESLAIDEYLATLDAEPACLLLLGYLP